MQDCYTAVTFSPVQGFIERSRKLRDLYGSSFILSYLAQAICRAAEAPGQEHQVISPALPDVARGTPNQIVIKGDFGFEPAKHSFDVAWRSLVKICQTWLEDNTSGPHYWKRDWNLWITYAWEFFWEQGSSISDARIRLNERKLCRAWTGINWTGESSTLSGTDAVAWPGLGYNRPDRRNTQTEKKQITQFYDELREELGEAFVDQTEELSIPELVKRMVTYKPITRLINNLTEDEVTKVQDVRSYADLNRKDTDRYTGWFRGDGDRIGLFLQNIGGDKEKVLNGFSRAMVCWAEKTLKHSLPFVSEDPKQLDKAGRIIYAGGDDFLGVLYHAEEDPKLSAWKCLNWFLTFNDQVWMKHHEELIKLLPEAQGNPPLTVSVGWVWAAPGVPQRDVLQHCDEAERAAKDKGRDRIAIRILFNSGNYLEWACPWWFLPHVFEDADQTDWIGLYKDVATLENRHAFEPEDHSVSLGLFEVYFSPEKRRLLEDHCWDHDGKVGILGNFKDQKQPRKQSLNSWICELAKIGFHLCSDI